MLATGRSVHFPPIRARFARRLFGREGCERQTQGESTWDESGGTESFPHPMNTALTWTTAPIDDQRGFCRPTALRIRSSFQLFIFSALRFPFEREPFANGNRVASKVLNEPEARHIRLAVT